MKTALISVSDKTGLEILLPLIKEWRILSTGGTAKRIRELGYDVTDVEAFTGSKEYPGGLVKTLHPKIHFAILMDRNNPEHLARAAEENIDPFDLVVCNLYPFAETIRKNPSRAVENIDIGGVAMIRAAAKNCKYVTVLVDPEDYGLLTQIPGEEFKKGMAVKAFRHTAGYDSVISNYFDPKSFPDRLQLSYPRTEKLRYGENWHQDAYLYSDSRMFTKLQGKAISYNNYNDLNGVVRILRDFMNHSHDAVVIISKHTNPCGIATSDNLYEAFVRAWDCDKTSAFGSVIGTNRDIDAKTAEFLSTRFVEVILAPGFDEDAMEILSRKNNLRLLKINNMSKFREQPKTDCQCLDFGVLCQTRDAEICKELEIKSGDLNMQARRDLIEFGILSIKNIKSNSINIVREYRAGYFDMIGAGIGQPNRVDAVKLAISKAKENLKSEFGDDFTTDGLFLISDAFFPFRDSIDLAGSEGIKNIVEPGGSIKDKEVIHAAEEQGINLVFTGMRHFRH